MNMRTESTYYVDKYKYLESMSALSAGNWDVGSTCSLCLPAMIHWTADKNNRRTPKSHYFLWCVF